MLRQIQSVGILLTRLQVGARHHRTGGNALQLLQLIVKRLLCIQSILACLRRSNRIIRIKNGLVLRAKLTGLLGDGRIGR